MAGGWGVHGNGREKGDVLMPRIHWLREKQRPGEGTIAAEKSWEWSTTHLGRLQYLRPLGPPPSLQHEGNNARPDLAPFRSAQFVVVQLEEPQKGHKAGYYHSSITPQQLAERLKEG